VSLLRPRVVVGGQVAAGAPELLFAGISERVYRRSLPLATAPLQIVPSAPGERARMTGDRTAAGRPGVRAAPGRCGADPFVSA
jgi:hypothetical protein